MTERAIRKRIVLFEVNEVNYELLLEAAACGKYPGIEKLTSLQYTETTTNDHYGSGYLEPWVQWVSIHTGCPSSEHHVMHLGDVPNAEFPQIWETLSQRGIHSGIWGIMNGSRREAVNCDFFVCDPWTASSDPYPVDLKRFTSLCQYISRNYLNINVLKFLFFGVEYGWSLLTTVPLSQLFTATGLVCTGLLQFGPSHAVLGSFYEYTSAALFALQKGNYQPALAVFFFNTLAHSQHHYWKNYGSISAELHFAFLVLDKTLQLLFSGLKPGEVLLVANGLSQQNTNQEEPWVLYRPKEPALMLKALGFKFERVEPLMTHDAHVFFKDQAARDQAVVKLDAITVVGKKLFYVEADRENPIKLFYRLEFTDHLEQSANFVCNDRSYRFFDHFVQIVVRTGRHNQRGFVLQTSPITPEKVLNHQIHDYICNYLSDVENTVEETRTGSKVS